MKIVYVCNFDLSRSSGKDRATRQKIKALSESVEEFKLLNISSKGQFFKIILLPWLELRASIWIVKNKPDVVISRGNVGLLFQKLAKLCSIKTLREVHADSIGEVDLLPHSVLKKKIICGFLKLSNFIDTRADIRIFNNPLLQSWYENSYSILNNFTVYNGFDPKSKSDLSRTSAIRKFGLSEDFDYLVFVGSVSKWHGAEYLVNLQKEFDRYGDKIKVVCGGGSLKNFDIEGRCINFTPLDEHGCADLIRAASACLLPVNMNRVSPGSPLKLYDYICNKKYVVTQKGLAGYSDEVERFRIGITVDFNYVENARNQILDLILQVRSQDEDYYPECNATWQERIRQWIKIIEYN